MDNSDDDVLTDQSCVDVVTLDTWAQRWPIPYESSNYISLYPSLVEKMKLIIAYWYFFPKYWYQESVFCCDDKYQIETIQKEETFCFMVSEVTVEGQLPSLFLGQWWGSISWLKGILEESCPSSGGQETVDRVVPWNKIESLKKRS